MIESNAGLLYTMSYLIIPIIIVFVILFVIIMKRVTKISKDNSIPMEAVLFCFVSRGRSDRSLSKSRISRDIPNLDKFGHLIPKRGGRIYSHRNKYAYVPAVVVTVNGETRLVISIGNSDRRLSEQDLGKTVNILYRRVGGYQTFVIKDVNR
ncbi:MAG: hypothetical protein FWD05_03200 [Oscillospiraceae bacterium]|nr:hypothetical protein [Oscillospiraceae bacterium]